MPPTQISNHPHLSILTTYNPKQFLPITSSNPALNQSYQPPKPNQPPEIKYHKPLT
jgi:hypothetical protein